MTINDNIFRPARKEVFKEMGNSVYKTTKNFLKESLPTTAGIAVTPYIIPTIVRKIRKDEFKERLLKEKSLKIGRITGGCIGILTYALQIPIYENVIKKYGWEATLLLIIPNVASGVYEIGRHFYKKTEKRLLEERLENSKSPLKS